MAGRTLTVYLAADTKRFRQGMNQAGTQARGLRGRLSSLSSTMSGMLGPALAGGAIAAGAFAVKLGVEGVQAAIDEEKELAKLTGTLKNLGFEDSTDEVNAFVEAQARASTFSDSDLRPAFARLLTSVKDVGEAQRLTSLAMDISVGTGKSLDSVVQALGKAYDGNVGGLNRLGIGLDKATVKTGDMDAITKILADRFAGQSAAASETMAGKLGNVSEAFDELKESFGAGFLSGLDGAEEGAGDLTTTLYDLQETAGNVGAKVAELAIQTSGLIQPALDANQAWIDLTDDLSNNDFAQGALAVINPIRDSFMALKAVILEVLVLMGQAQKVGQAQGTITDLGSLTPRPVNLGGGSARSVTEQQVGSAISNVIAKTDARRGYVVGGVLR
jgi:hypothetical protein